MSLKTLHQDVIIGVVFILLSLFLFVETLGFNNEAAIYPRVLFIMMMLLAVFIIMGGIKKSKALRKNKEVNYEGEEDTLSWKLIKSPLTALGFIIVYGVLIGTLGFFTSTVLFIMIFLRYMGIKKLRIYLYTTIGFTLFIYILFVVQLNVRLPSGILF